MKLFVTIAGRELVVEARGARGDRSVYAVDGKEVLVDLDGRDGRIRVHSGGQCITVDEQPPRAGSQAAGKLRLLADQRPIDAAVESERDRLRRAAHAPQARRGRVTLHSTLPGIIRRVLRQAGDEVAEGEAILTLEAMKMENEVRAEAPGRLVAVRVKPGQVVQAGEALAEIESE